MNKTDKTDNPLTSQTVTINTKNPYDVIIEKNLLKKSGVLIRSLNYIGENTKLAIITDDNVNRLYTPTLLNSLKQSGFKSPVFVFKNGEQSKNLLTFEGILSFLSEQEFDRGDVVITLGGGVVGDLGGFAACAYMRGIRFIQIPTTLLACVDSSVGGKTGVNLKSGKNLVGAFHQPSLVICDPLTLGTLDDINLKSGCGEVVKYAILKGGRLLSLLGSPISNTSETLTEIIAECIKIKRDIVMADEFEKNERKLLNLGHTIAHSLETLSGYNTPHGIAVALGIKAAADMAHKIGICDKICVDGVEKLLSAQNLLASPCRPRPNHLSYPDYSKDELYLACLSDKKRSGDFITMVFPKKIGECVLKDINISYLKELL